VPEQAIPTPPLTGTAPPAGVAPNSLGGWSVLQEAWNRELPAALNECIRLQAAIDVELRS
jgi:hypothetical protein